MGFFFVEVRLDESLNVLGFRKLLLFFTPSVLRFYFSNNFHELFGNLGALAEIFQRYWVSEIISLYF